MLFIVIVTVLCREVSFAFFCQLKCIDSKLARVVFSLIRTVVLNMIYGLDQGCLLLRSSYDSGHNRTNHHNAFEEPTHVPHVVNNAFMLQLVQTAEVIRQKVHLG